jgi:hypothetical protein
MGHASRPRRHNALGLDAQSRGVCVPAARSAQSDPNAHGLADSNGNSDSDSDGNFYTDTETYTHTEGCTDAEAASYAATAAVMRVKEIDA